MAALERLRGAWGCDCSGPVDGPSRATSEQRAVEALREAMERITGHRPVSCPWHAYYDPLVREVMAVSWSAESGNLAAALGEDPPAILVDALGVYRSALAATLAEDRRLAEEERKARG